MNTPATILAVDLHDMSVDVRVPFAADGLATTNLLTVTSIPEWLDQGLIDNTDVLNKKTCVVAIEVEGQQLPLPDSFRKASIFLDMERGQFAYAVADEIPAALVVRVYRHNLNRRPVTTEPTPS